MASGNFDIGTSNGLSVRINWSSTSNGTDANTSTVTAHLQIKKATSIPTLGTWSYRFTAGDSKTITTKYASVGNSWVTLASKTVTIKHSADGSGSCYFWGRVTAPSGTTLSGVDISKTGTVTLDKIPQHGYITSLSVYTFNSSTKVTVNYFNPAGEVLEDLQTCISLTGAKADIPYRAVSKTGTSYTFTLTAAELNTLYNAMPNANSLKVRFYIQSKLNGAYKRTYKEATFNITNKTINVSATIEDTNTKTVALTGDKNKLVKGYSNISYSITASPATVGSTISAVSIKNGSTTKTTATGNYYNITDASFVVWGKDTRGNSTSKTITKTMVNYIPLTCTLAVDMPDISGVAPFTVTGNYFNGSFGATNNSVTVKVRQKINGVYSNWQTVTDVTISGNTYSATGTLAGFTQDKEAIVEVTVTDKLLTRTDTQNVLIIPVFDWSMDDFNFNVPVTIKGDLTVSGSVSFDYGSQDTLWSGAWFMHGTQTADLSKPISEQANGIVLVFSRYSSGALDIGWNTFFIPKTMVSYNKGAEQTFIMATSKFAEICTKCLIINDNNIKGNADNDDSGTVNGITFNNSAFVLRYVIGV